MIIKIILVYILTLPVLFADDESDIKYQFWSFAEKINKKDVGFIDDLDPKSAKTLREYLQKELSEKIGNNLDVTGLPDEYQKLDDQVFLKISLNHVFKNHPDIYEESPPPKVHGVVFDSNEAYLVYSINSNDGQFSVPCAMGFRKANGVWKITTIARTFYITIPRIWNSDNIVEQ